MKYPEYFRVSLVQNLGFRIAEGLARGASISYDTETHSMRLIGALPLEMPDHPTQKLARCEFVLSDEWPSKIPSVKCLESWTTRMIPDWHVYSDGRLCFEFDLHWARELPAIVELHTEGLAARFAASWVLNSTKWLLNRHLIARRQGLTRWPEAWDFWGHGFDTAKRQLDEKYSQVA